MKLFQKKAKVSTDSENFRTLMKTYKRKTRKLNELTEELSLQVLTKTVEKRDG